MSNVPVFKLIKPKDWYFQTHGDVSDGIRRSVEFEELNKTLDGAEYHIEEFVRQWALRFLIEDYGYPSEWLGERIIIEEPVKMGSSSKEADISIKNTNRRTYLYIEVKKRGISNTDFEEAERQLETYLASTHTATIGMVTDGDRTKILRKKIDPNDFDYVADIPAFGKETKAQTQLVRSIPKGGNPKSTGLKTIEGEYDRVLFDCHSAVRQV